MSQQHEINMNSWQIFLSSKPTDAQLDAERRCNVSDKFASVSEKLHRPLLADDTRSEVVTLTDDELFKEAPEPLFPDTLMSYLLNLNMLEQTSISTRDHNVCRLKLRLRFASVLRMSIRRLAWRCEFLHAHFLHVHEHAADETLNAKS